MSSRNQYWGGSRVAGGDQQGSGYHSGNRWNSGNRNSYNNNRNSNRNDYSDHETGSNYNYRPNNRRTNNYRRGQNSSGGVYHQGGASGSSYHSAFGGSSSSSSNWRVRHNSISSATTSVSTGATSSNPNTPNTLFSADPTGRNSFPSSASTPTNTAGSSASGNNATGSNSRRNSPSRRSNPVARAAALAADSASNNTNAAPSVNSPRGSSNENTNPLSMTPAALLLGGRRRNTNSSVHSNLSSTATSVNNRRNTKRQRTSKSGKYVKVGLSEAQLANELLKLGGPAYADRTKCDDAIDPISQLRIWDFSEEGALMEDGSKKRVANYSEISYLFSYVEEQEIAIANSKGKGKESSPELRNSFDNKLNSDAVMVKTDSKETASSKSSNAMSVCDSAAKKTPMKKKPRKKVIQYVRGFAVESIQQMLFQAKKNQTNVLKNPISNQIIPHNAVCRAKRMIKILTENKRIEKIEDEDPLVWSLDFVKANGPGLTAEENRKKSEEKIRQISFSLFQQFYAKANLEIPDTLLAGLPMKELKLLAKDCKTLYVRNFTSDQKKLLCPETYGNAFVDPPYWDGDVIGWKFYILNNIYYICGGYNVKAPEYLIKMVMYVFVAGFGAVNQEVRQRYEDSFCFDINPLGYGNRDSRSSASSADNRNQNSSPSSNRRSDRSHPRNNERSNSSPDLTARRGGSSGRSGGNDADMGGTSAQPSSSSTATASAPPRTDFSAFNAGSAANRARTTAASSAGPRTVRGGTGSRRSGSNSAAQNDGDVSMRNSFDMDVTEDAGNNRTANRASPASPDVNQDVVMEFMQDIDQMEAELAGGNRG